MRGGSVSAYCSCDLAEQLYRSIEYRGCYVTLTGQGNTHDLLLDGAESFAARKSLIENAQESIYLQTFIFTDDETGWDTARLLAKRAQEGIDVRVLSIRARHL